MVSFIVYISLSDVVCSIIVKIWSNYYYNRLKKYNPLPIIILPLTLQNPILL